MESTGGLDHWYNDNNIDNENDENNSNDINWKNQLYFLNNMKIIRPVSRFAG